MEEVTNIFELPFQTLASLAAGYLGYRLAYTARDTSHKTVDVIFFVAVFAFIARLVTFLVGSALSSLIPRSETSELPLQEILARLNLTKPQPDYLFVTAAIFGVIAALIAAGIWRGWLEEKIKEKLSDWQISRSDRSPTALQSIVQTTSAPLSSMTVQKTDGSQLICEKFQTFEELKHGPCIIGDDGSVAMYVTKFRRSIEDDWIDITPFDPDWGAEISYIPKQEIAEIRFSHQATFSEEALKELLVSP